MGFADWLRQALSGGDDELGRDDLVRGIADGILALRSWGDRGAEVLPTDAVVRVAAPADRHPVLQRMLDDAALARDVGAQVLNRAPSVPAGGVPRWTWTLVDAPTPSIAVDAAPARTLVLRLEDASGAVVALGTAQREWRIGRGPWHGPEQVVANDLALPESARWVSRRAARLVRAGAQVLVEALDQGESLVVERASGEIVRPVRVAQGRVPLAPGDRVAFVDGGQRIALVVEERAP